jgi:hypothetical protein
MVANNADVRIFGDLRAASLRIRPDARTSL